MWSSRYEMRQAYLRIPGIYERVTITDTAQMRNLKGLIDLKIPRISI